MSFFNLIKNAVDKVQEKNRANPNVETADNSVFENLIKKVKDAQNRKRGKEVDLPDEEVSIEDIQKHVEEVRVENEADPNIQTADNSVFEEMLREMARVKAENARLRESGAAVEDAGEVVGAATPESTMEVNVDDLPPVVFAEPEDPSAPPRIMAMTNSNAGSLQFRTEPRMDATVTNVFIPDQSMIQVLGYSENKIILDGKESRFVKVNYDGKQGWVLEGYLNFN